MLIDGDIYFAEAGKVSLVVGRSGWKTGAIGDDVLHPAADFTRLASSSHVSGTGTSAQILDDDLGSGTLYAYDSDAARIVAFSKNDGSYQQQYRLASGDTSWAGLRALLPRARGRLGATVRRLDRCRQRGHRAARRGPRHDHRHARPEPIAVGQSLRLAEAQAQADRAAHPEADQEAVMGVPPPPHRPVPTRPDARDRVG